MMSKEKRRVPKLRFPGFTEDWEQRKFKDIAFKRGKISEADLPYVEFEDINSGIGTLNKNISQKVGHKKGLLFEAGDVLFGKLRPYLQNWLLCQFAGIAVGDFWVLQPQNVSSAFLYYLIQSEAYQSVANISSGTKMPRSSWPLVSETLFSIPKYKEANMIGEFFLLIDRTITLHQRKLNNLKLKKKALLQKLFPKNEERYPELRFPGFTDAWEQRKLSDILVERNEQQVETNEYPLMSFVQGHGVIPKGERYDRSFLVLDQSKKYKRTELGDFIYSSNNLETGSIGINKTGKAVISPVYSIFYGVSIGDSQFIGIMSLLPRFIAKMIRFRQGVVYGQWRIHEKDFLDISILIPSEAERTKITKLILSIEELITLHQRKLDHLQLQKKALLQQMFV